MKSAPFFCKTTKIYMNLEGVKKKPSFVNDARHLFNVFLWRGALVKTIVNRRKIDDII